jgi:hypothetical protein
MITDRDVTVKQEQHRDRLNRAERQRRIEQMNGDKTKSTFWQQIGNLISRHDKKGRAACSETGKIQTQSSSSLG